MRSTIKNLSTAMLMFSAIGVQAAPMYTITDLGAFHNDGSTGYDVNDTGEVTGWSHTRHGGTPFISDANGPMVAVQGGGWGINNSGQMAGSMWTTGGLYHASIGSRTQGPIDLGTLGGDQSQALSINDSGQVAGSSYTSNGSVRAIIGDITGLTDLGTLGGAHSYGRDINESGLVAGFSTTSNGDTRAFVGDTNGLVELGTLGGNHSQGFGINDNGLVTGYSLTAESGKAHAFIGDANGLTDIGSLGGNLSYGYGINNSNEVVGTSQVLREPSQAFYWNPVDGILNLEDLIVDFTGWGHLGIAFAISNTGYITGYGSISNYTLARRAFLLTPVVQNQVSEPPPLLLLSIGFVILGFRYSALMNNR